MVNLEAELPAPSSERIAVHVTNDALRQIRGGHPWVWDGSIVRASAEGTAGDLAVIFDDKRKFAAIGLWDPNAPTSYLLRSPADRRCRTTTTQRRSD